MYKRWVKRDGEELWAPLDDSGRVVMAAQRASMGPGECVGTYRIDGNGAVVVVGPVVKRRTPPIEVKRVVREEEKE